MVSTHAPDICVFDVEGASDERGIQGVAIYSATTVTYETDVQKALDILADECHRGCTLVAHNAEYDISVLFWQLREKVECRYYDGTFNHALWWYHEEDKPATIIDSLHLAGNLSVALLGEAIGLPKLQTPQRLLGRDPDRYAWVCEKHGIGECEECYAIRDAEIVYRYMETYISDLGTYGVPFRRRLGSTAVNIWRNTDGKDDVSIKSESMRTLARKAYHGGRTECFKIGTLRNLNVYDVTSMYPSVMYDEVFPDPHSLQYANGKARTLALLEYEGVSDVDIVIPDTYIPLLPVNIDNRLVYPVGMVRGTYTHVELRAAVEAGCTILHTYDTLYSTDTVRPFRHFVETMWAKRLYYKEKRDPREHVVKILLNSLYGRMGMHGDQTYTRIAPLAPGQRIQDCHGYEVGEMGGVLCRRKDSVLMHPSPDANVMWAAYITAYARLRLWRYLLQAGSSLVYCDTDSVVTTGVLTEEEYALGALRFEGHYDEGEFLAPKMYSLTTLDGERKVHIKGIPAKVREQYMRDAAVDYDAPYRILESWRLGEKPGVWHVVHKERMQLPAKRQIVREGEFTPDMRWYDTVPVVLEDAGPDSYWKGLDSD